MSNNLWELIKTARVEAGLTQKQLAELTGVTKVTVSRWETKNPEERMSPQMFTLKQIAEATGVPLGDFIDCILQNKIKEELGEGEQDEETYATNLWEKIRVARVNAKMTQQDLAKACGVSRATVNAWESPKNQFKNSRRMSLKRIAEATNTPIEWFAEPSSDEKPIWEVIKEARVLAGLTQEALGSLVGVNGSTVCKWESKKAEMRVVPDMQVITKIAKVTNKPLSTFIDALSNNQTDEEDSNDSIDNVGQKIKIARSQANMTQQELADALGVPRITINSWEKPENEEPLQERKTLRRIAEVTGVSLEWLESNNPTPKTIIEQYSKPDIEEDIEKLQIARQTEAKKIVMGMYSYISDHGISQEFFEMLRILDSTMKRYQK
ncbi:helix-turn-helix domain-containing protein [Zooshikella ganghwensis]|uniref:XRE family transcriptional regulator n=1 Tax=Zooshikella ganghwensis TaxID=202772 RepID=A0A4P9VGW8_9GAMM|nr:helix-turn-helix transcriptional regulator [Zooshikella ganghwensis]RDH41619.1 XRE family transcriptional regulator [Zooshikella ganghwensis]